MSFLQVSVFPGRQLGDYFPNHVARTKILVAMAPKVVAAWRVARTLKVTGNHVKFARFMLLAVSEEAKT